MTFWDFADKHTDLTGFTVCLVASLLWWSLLVGLDVHTNRTRARIAEAQAKARKEAS